MLKMEAAALVTQCLKYVPQRTSSILKNCFLLGLQTLLSPTSPLSTA